MNWKTWVPLVLAIVLGLVAMKVARDVTMKNRGNAAPDDGSHLVVLNKDLAAGAPLTAADLATTEVPGKISSESVFTKTQDLEGRVLLVPCVKGVPIVQSMLAPVGTGAGLQSLIPDGMRALTIEINEFSGVAGNLTTGCRVDVVSTLASDSPSGEMMARTVVQNVKVQALGMRRGGDADPNAGPVRSVTLLATPKEAEAIELAVATGRPQLVLRSSKDNEVASSSGVSLSELRRGNTPHLDPFAAAGTSGVAQAVSTAFGSGSHQPTTGPSVSTGPKAHERQIRIIRGGIESVTSVEESPVPAVTPPEEPAGPRWMTDAGAEELPETNAGD